MEKICSIMQPTYLPWMGYFDLIDQADHFVFLDDVQLVKRSWMVRNRIKTGQGPLFLTIPVEKTKHRDEQMLHESGIDFSQNWIKKHLNSIEQAYRKAPFFNPVFAFVEEIFNHVPVRLADFNINTIIRIAGKLNMGNVFYRSSSIDTGDLSQAEKLLKICESLNCNVYLSPQGSADYLERDIPGSVFGQSVVTLYYMNYDHPSYSQMNGRFESHMCILDLLFNAGFDRAPEIIRSGRRPKYHFTEFRENSIQRRKT